MLTTTTGGALVPGAVRLEKGKHAMKLKMLVDCVTPLGFAHKDEVVEVEAVEARLLIRMGRAILAPEEILEVVKPEAPARNVRKGR